MLMELIDELIERDPIWLSWRTQDTQNYIVNCWNWTHGTPIDNEAVHLFLCDERYGNLTEEQRSFAKERKAEIHEKHRRAVLRLLQLAEVPPAGPAKSPIEFLQFLAPPKARREAPCMPL